jgi:8-amino-7-oxononanoate synthase
VTGALEGLRDSLSRGLAERRAQALERRLEVPRGIDLTSNDYLGYARDPELAAALGRAVAEHGSGSGAARLLGGQSALLERVEATLATYVGREAALCMSSGYAANLGLMPALIGEGDRVLSDALNHASIIDGLRLTRAERRTLPHGDLDALETALREPRRGRAWIVVESVYSMEGELAPLRDICALARRHDALVIVDEAHATGLYGPSGAGRVAELGLEREVVCTLHTGGKALGVGGAWVAGDAVLIAHLVNHCRSFIYSTAPVPAISLGLELAIAKRRGDQETVNGVHRKAESLCERLRAAGLASTGRGSPIVPVTCASSEVALAIAAGLREAGFEVRAVRPPTVPSPRLRLVVRAPVAEADLARLVPLLAGLARRVAP